VHEKEFYKFNASQLVTWWGGDKESTIFDYAWREWKGLIADYYYESLRMCVLFNEYY